MITIPERLCQKALNVSQGSRQWLAGLPEVCRRLSDEWSLDLGSPFAGCHVSLVVTANRGPRRLVLKVPMPSTVELGTLPAGARAAEADALREWAGDGAVQLAEYDPATGAMLVERCEPGATLDHVDNPDDADRVAAEVLERLHRPGLPRPQFDRLADRAVRLAHALPARYEMAGAPFDQWLLDTAVDLLGQLSRSGPAEVLLHGDFHLENILSAEREPWLAIDPLPMVGDPAYDAVQYLLFRKGDLADPPTEWATAIAQFSARLDLDAERVKAWMFARLVSDALAAYTQGMTMTELGAWQGDLWSARLVHHLRE
ncbi:aminoglycoside phosphotransferase family protein [Actinopolymorpha alba]|uniref:aminoglycoside phosphotransferase family protein n=1 Tax=Actinopolymorpha alba TaxID=533267 RepID=UPI00036E2F15|nr:aminoglycoside phosphotransferase family protein [Actinopolymorpha alba]